MLFRSRSALAALQSDYSEKIKTLLDSFEADVDILHADNENLFNWTTTTLPQFSPDMLTLIIFKAQFNRCLALASDGWEFSSFLLGIKHQILNSEQISLSSVNDLLAKCPEENHEQLRRICMSSSSTSWIGDILLSLLAAKYSVWSEQLKSTNISLLSPHHFQTQMKVALKSGETGLNCHQPLLTALLEVLSAECRGIFTKPQQDYCQLIMHELSKDRGKDKSSYSPGIIIKLKETPLSRWPLVKIGRAHV